MLGEFKELDALPVQVIIPTDVTAEILAANNAAWHRSCHQKFNNSKLDRARNKKRKLQGCEEDTRKSKRHSTTANMNLCIFCKSENSSYKLHAYSTFSAEKSLREMAEEMQDTSMMAIISGGDLVALEAKYHVICLTKYRNRYRSYMRKKNGKQSDAREKAKARAFAELVMTIQNSLEDGDYIFKLSEIRQLYETRLHQLGEDISVNKTLFKEKLLDAFADLGITEQCVGKNIHLVFPDAMQEMLRNEELYKNYGEEALILMKAAKICRDEMLQLGSEFTGSFPPNCQERSVSHNLKLLTSMIMYGSNMKESATFSQPCLTVSQLMTYNCKKTVSMSANVKRRHNLEREPPLPVYIGMNIHAQTRSKTLIEELALLGISITYDRVIDLESEMNLKMCKLFDVENLVCPANLRKNIFTVGALDNIDHNLSSTTAQNSFHGTGISIIQFPSADSPGVSRDAEEIGSSSNVKQGLLPESYSIVPAIAALSPIARLPERAMSDVTGYVASELLEEQKWIKQALEILTAEFLDKGQAISWAAYHALSQRADLPTPAITAMLPLFTEKADSPSMVKHGIDQIIQITHHLNPGQIPVMACDCPIFALCKSIQWKWPELYGEDKLTIMFGGLHLEKGLWNALGDFMDGSGWTEALTESGVASSGVADSFIKASHITRTRHVHQVSVLALSKLMQAAYDKRDSTFFPGGLEDWRQEMVKQSPTFHFWDIVLRTQLLILMFVRAHREGNFNLYVESLEVLLFLFFALDHFNYSRWVSVHLRDMKSLPDSAKRDLTNNWVASKTKKRFSKIPLDQVHEQENAKVKGKGGIIGITDNPVALQRWLVTGPEKRRLLDEFEELFLSPDDTDASYLHHEEGVSAQNRFHQQVKEFVATVEDFGNPFEENGSDLLVLHSHTVANVLVTETVRHIEDLGKSQYETFKQEVIVERTKPITDRIKKNSLILFKTPEKKKNPKAQKLAGLRNDLSLFGRLYIANQRRDGDPAVFFAHENQLYPPALSDNGRIHQGQKHELLRCLITDEKRDVPSHFDAKILDGAVTVHGISSEKFVTFKDYAEHGFIPVVFCELHSATRIDIVWDTYLENSIKGYTREKRGTGTRVRVGANVKLPKKWNMFLRDSDNKTELFNFLSIEMSNTECPVGKEIYITNGQSVVANGGGSPMGICTQEEADTRLVVHLLHALQTGSRKVSIRTVDTNIIVILIGQFYNIVQQFPDADIWVIFGTGKNIRYHSINHICTQLGKDRSYSLPAFHAFSGCDTSSSFYRKGKKSSWEAWKRYPDVTEAFITMFHHPFSTDVVDPESRTFQKLERFTVVLYDRTSTLTSVNELRRELFSKRGKSLENLPPTQDALVQHVKRATYQCGIWSTCQAEQPVIPSPSSWGWKLVNNSWDPVWMTLPEASKVCTELIKCNCKSANGCTLRCKCCKSNLPCTELCGCNCQK